jgi:hypothetical protein
VAESVYGKRAKVYFFDPVSGRTRDISDLDPGAEDAAEAEWGGLTSFSGRVGKVVSKVVNAAGRVMAPAASSTMPVGEAVSKVVNAAGH